MVFIKYKGCDMYVNSYNPETGYTFMSNLTEEALDFESKKEANNVLQVIKIKNKSEFEIVEE